MSYGYKLRIFWIASRSYRYNASSSASSSAASVSSKDKKWRRINLSYSKTSAMEVSDLSPPDNICQIFHLLLWQCNVYLNPLIKFFFIVAEQNIFFIFVFICCSIFPWSLDNGRQISRTAVKHETEKFFKSFIDVFKPRLNSFSKFTDQRVLDFLLSPDRKFFFEKSIRSGISWYSFITSAPDQCQYPRDRFLYARFVFHVSQTFCDFSFIHESQIIHEPMTALLFLPQNFSPNHICLTSWFWWFHLRLWDGYCFKEKRSSWS